MPKRYWYVILTYLIMQLSGLFVVPIIEIMDVDRFTAGVYWSIFSFLAALAIILLLLREDMKVGSERGAAGVGSIILWSILGIFLAYFAQFLSVIIETFILNIPPGSENTQDIMSITRSAPIFVLVVVVVAPILEEVIFRKIIFGSIYKKTNFIIAAVASALVFALVHGDPLHLITYMSMGFVFAFLYVQTKRIIVPIITHMAMNGFTVVAQYNMDPEEMEKMLEQFEKLQMIIIGG
ncbi:CPBP family intramembrane metalloprotease [Radiobacillus kanasensis]|uniref:CPBP family intramembrane glutamic endopeptidase n=1 Tax=Radiobacillus kanasensis TaxID=2844358 RepID=UPI001E6206E4|nr:type II CAAX endopeptidase family protein [Radiobacillus kanasensis]UFT99841.1 CPBP family intramembrane metalloprotease [Radiobacillus kanasensis]